MSKRKLNKFRHRSDMPASRPFADLVHMGRLKGSLKRGEITFDQIPDKYKKQSAPVVDSADHKLELSQDVPGEVEAHVHIEPHNETEVHVHGEHCEHH